MTAEPSQRSSPASLPLLSSFDPAIHLHSAFDHDLVPPVIIRSQSHSDELNALHLQHAEDIARKNKNAIVIQHRAWATGDVFKSEEDYLIDSPLRKRRRLRDQPSPDSSNRHTLIPPSSPPSAAKMPLISSPVAYPPSSSPPVPRTKTKPSHNGEAASHVPNTRAGFVMDDEDEEEEEVQIGGVSEAHSVHSLVGLSTAPPHQSEQSWSQMQGQNTSDKVHCSTSILASPNGAARTSFSFVKPPQARAAPENSPRKRFRQLPIRTCSGKAFSVSSRSESPVTSFENLIAQRSATQRSATIPGRAKTSYYGIDIHTLLEENGKDNKVLSDKSSQATEHVSPHPSVETPASGQNLQRTLMWTEKYRARNFTDLVGDERTHRSVLGWLKGWDPIVFPGSARRKPLRKANAEHIAPREHRKVLLLTGPPGLGKTTLAHVCAKQAGYEVLEINASDERSSQVVKGRIRDSLGTQNVRGVSVKTPRGKVRRAGRPVCVIVDEVDGVVSGSSHAGGEGGFIKALIDLVLLDQKNSGISGSAAHSSTQSTKRKKGDNFRLLRPLILICNDVYHPALRPLRQSTFADIVHVRKAALNMVVSRLKSIFEKEGFVCDGDGVRRLCEATWGITSRRDGGTGASGTGEGDLRGILVVGEWVARKLRASVSSSLSAVARLTRSWVEQHVIGDLSHGGGGNRGMGRGGSKEVADRVFLEGAGFPNSINSGPPKDYQGVGGGSTGVAELGKRRAIERLREMTDICGEPDRVVSDCFSAFPSQPFQDDMLLSKPNAAYDWLHFHDAISSKVFSGQEWELSGYLSQPVLAFHHLFSSPVRHAWSSGAKRFDDEEDDEPLPFSGPRADYQAREAQKHNRALLSSLLSTLSVPLLRSFRSPESIAADLLPPLMQILTPDVKPVVVGGSGEQRGVASVRKESERDMVRRAVGAMSGIGVVFERGRLDTGLDGRGGGWVYRMEPPLDTLTTFETAGSPSSTSSGPVPVRYAVRQVLEQEYQKHILVQQNEARQARYRAGGAGLPDEDPSLFSKTTAAPTTSTSKQSSGSKRDFFGRVIVNEASRPLSSDRETGDGDECMAKKRRRAEDMQGGDTGDADCGLENKVWVSFHEGFSNAVRKPVTLEEFIYGL